MSKLLGSGPLKLGNHVQGKTPQRDSSTVRNFMCRAPGCGVNFTFYKGVKTYPGGTGLCKKHNPDYQEPDK